jgi:hypothetical protein
MLCHSIDVAKSRSASYTIQQYNYNLNSIYTYRVLSTGNRTVNQSLHVAHFLICLRTKCEPSQISKAEIAMQQTEMQLRGMSAVLYNNHRIQNCLYFLNLYFLIYFVFYFLIFYYFNFF